MRLSTPPGWAPYPKEIKWKIASKDYKKCLQLNIGSLHVTSQEESMSMWTPLRWPLVIMRSNANPSLFRKAHPHGVRWPTTLLTACLSPSWAEAWRWLWGTSSKSPPPSTTPLRRGLCPPDSVGSTHWEGVVKSLKIRGFNHWPQVRQWRGEMHCLQAVWGCVPCPGTRSGVSIIFKIRVFYKARFEGFEFFIRWPYAVFHKMQVVFYKSAHFMYLWGINSVFAKCALQSSKILK